MTVWIIERRPAHVSFADWEPIPGESFRYGEKAREFAERNQSRFWQYRAVEYQRKEK